MEVEKEMPLDVIWNGPVLPDPEPVVLLEMETGDSFSGPPNVTSPPLIS
jgi:hypothetical protein